MLFTLRISLPDRPGSLGAVASALGNGGANILTLDVVERSDGIAVDDLCVEAPEGMQEPLRRAAEEVPGLVVEDVRPSGMFLKILSPMQLAATLTQTPPDKVLSVLVENLAGALWANWSAAVTGGPEPKVLEKSIGSPGFEALSTPWMPLDGPRRLEGATWSPSKTGFSPAVSNAKAPELAVAALSGPHSAIIVGRTEGPRFRESELKHLELLALTAASLSDSAQEPTPDLLTT